MADWEETEIKGSTVWKATIDDAQYRVYKKGTYRGTDFYVSEFFWNNSSWERIGSTFNSAEEARRDVEEYAVHLVEKVALNRKSESLVDGKRPFTPWGAPQSVTEYAPGVKLYETARHGGFKVSASVMKGFPTCLRTEGGWYEEDSEWAKVATALPHIFTQRERRQAERTLRDSEPDIWEALNGRYLQPGESYQRDKEIFAAKHANDLVVISAIGLHGEQEGMVKVTATVGGSRDNINDAREFLVPSEEYEGRSGFGFVVDPVKHQEITEQSSMKPR